MIDLKTVKSPHGNPQWAPLQCPVFALRLVAAARKSSRYGHRDATMILIGYRHGLRASELCEMQWSQVELNAGRLHVRHPLQGNEIRALRRLQREQEASPHVFSSERGGPMT